MLFKDRLIEYLRSFVKSLQLNATNIEQLLSKLPKDQIQMILERLTEYELSIPRIDVEVTRQQLWDKIHGRWASIENWFLGSTGSGSEAGLAVVFGIEKPLHLKGISKEKRKVSIAVHMKKNQRCLQLFQEYGLIVRSHNEKELLIAQKKKRK